MQHTKKTVFHFILCFWSHNEAIKFSWNKIIHLMKKKRSNKDSLYTLHFSLHEMLFIKLQKISMMHLISGFLKLEKRKAVTYPLWYGIQTIIHITKDKITSPVTSKTMNVNSAANQNREIYNSMMQLCYQSAVTCLLRCQLQTKITNK